MNYQSLASAIMADWKSKVNGEELEDLVLKSVISEHIDKIADKSGEI